MQQNEISAWCFNENLVRTVDLKDSEIWFVGKDIANSLGYSNTRDALLKHVDEEDKTLVALYDGVGNPNQIVINESGVYSLIFSSKLESAKQFKHWVTKEVLPAIRKTGSYSVNPLKEIYADTGNKAKQAKVLAQQIQLLRAVEILVDKGLIRKENFLSVIEEFNSRARTMEPLANMREKEIKENAKLLDFVAESISITGSDTDTIDADSLYVLYIDHTEGDVLKSGTFKNRMETLFPQLRYAMSEENGILTQMVYGVKIKESK